MAAKKATSKRSAKRSSKTAQVPPTRATSPETATGNALAEDTRELPTGKDRGSTAPGAGEATETGGKATGAQAEAAQFSTNGSLPNRRLPTPSGPVPASAIHKDKDAADKAVEQHEEEVATAAAGNGGQKISEATVGRLGKQELRAIAVTRGYDIPMEAGTRGTRNAFLKAQAEDKSLKSSEAGSVYETPGGKKSKRS